MAQVDYLHLCDLSFMDQAGKHCIIGMFDIIQASAFPTTHPTMSLAMRILGAPGEALKVAFEMGRPNGDVLVTIPLDVAAGPDGGCNINLSLNQMQFPEPGRYTLKVLSGKEVLASRSLRVIKVDQTAPQGQPNPARQDKSKLH
jgi:hypothetical protein